MVNNSTTLMTRHYSAAACRAIRVSFMQRFTAVDAESRDREVNLDYYDENTTDFRLLLTRF